MSKQKIVKYVVAAIALVAFVWWLFASWSHEGYALILFFVGLMMLFTGNVVLQHVTSVTGG